MEHYETSWIWGRCFDSVNAHNPVIPHGNQARSETVGLPIRIQPRRRAHGASIVPYWSGRCCGHQSRQTRVPALLEDGLLDTVQTRVVWGRPTRVNRRSAPGCPVSEM